MNIGIWCKDFLWRDKLKNIITTLGGVPIKITSPLEPLPESLVGSLIVISLSDFYTLNQGAVVAVPSNCTTIGYFPHVEEHLEAYGNAIGCTLVSSRGALEKNISRFCAQMNQL